MDFSLHYKIMRFFIWAYPLHNSFQDLTTLFPSFQYAMLSTAHWYSVVRQALLSCRVASLDTAVLFTFKEVRLRTWSKEAYISQKFLVDFCLHIIAQADWEWALLVTKLGGNVDI